MRIDSRGRVWMSHVMSLNDAKNRIYFNTNGSTDFYTGTTYNYYNTNLSNIFSLDASGNIATNGKTNCHKYICSPNSVGLTTNFNGSGNSGFYIRTNDWWQGAGYHWANLNCCFTISLTSATRIIWTGRILINGDSGGVVNVTQEYNSGGAVSITDAWDSSGNKYIRISSTTITTDGNTCGYKIYG